MTRQPTHLLAVLRPLLDQALDLEPAEREGFIARLRAEQPAHAAEVEALLAAEVGLDAAAFLADGTWDGPESAAPGLAGQRLGAYTLERPLGQGGMGTVWLGRRSDGRYDASAAVKLLNLALLDPVGAERFRREGTVLARLSHPHIARLLDAGVTDAGVPYLVLEHVEGTRIDAYCDERRLPPEARLKLFLDVLGAVGHAHANLIVHRDLKPSNILVTADGTAKLLDFGIAKLLEAERAGAETSTLTDVGGRALTPEYAAPEQVAGEAITTATDVYSLGVLLYVLLAGRHPTGEPGLTSAEHLRGVLDTEPPRLSAAVVPAKAAERGSSTERLRRLYAGDLGNIVAKTLKKRPEERYATVGALADDLQRYLSHQPVQARPDSWAYRAGKFVRRHRGPVAAGVLVALALLGAVGMTWHQMIVARQQRDEALFQFRRAEAIGDFQTAIISQIGATRLSLSDLLEQNVTVLARRPPADPRLHAALLLQFADRYGELERRNEQRALLASAQAQAARSADAQLQATLGCAIAKYHTEQRQADSAMRELERVRVRLASVTQVDPETRVNCLRPAAELAYQQQQLDSAAALEGQAAAILDSIGAAGTLRYYTVESERASYVRAAGRVREAITLGQSTRDGMKSLGLGGSVLASSVNNNLAETLFERGERREGLDILREVLEQVRQADPTSGVHPVVGFNYASQLAADGAADSALFWFQAVATSARAKSIAEIERRAMLGVARNSARLGRTADARRAFARMLAIAREQGKPVPRESLFVTASIALAEGDSARAASTFEQVLRQDGYFTGKRRRTSRAPLINLTHIALGRGRPGEALTFARALREMGMLDSLAAFRSADVGEADLLAAYAHAAEGRADSAKAYAQSALAALSVGAGPAHALTQETAALLDSLAR
jgi:serine/threonine protein kinase